MTSYVEHFIKITNYNCNICIALFQQLNAQVAQKNCFTLERYFGFYAISVCCWSTAVFPFIDNTTNNRLCLTVIGLLQQNITLARLAFKSYSSFTFSFKQKQPKPQGSSEILFCGLPGCSERQAYRLFPHLHLSSDERERGERNTQIS